jgi:CRISPR system Cascade subunit CasD
MRLEPVLETVPWQASAWYRRRQGSRTPQELIVLKEAVGGEHSHADALRDQPVSFAAAHRRHALRTVVTTSVPIPGLETAGAVRHDPFDALEDESS